MGGYQRIGTPRIRHARRGICGGGEGGEIMTHRTENLIFALAVAAALALLWYLETL